MAKVGILSRLAHEKTTFKCILQIQLQTQIYYDNENYD